MRKLIVCKTLSEVKDSNAAILNPKVVILKADENSEEITIYYIHSTLCNLWITILQSPQPEGKSPTILHQKTALNFVLETALCYRRLLALLCALLLRQSSNVVVLRTISTAFSLNKVESNAIELLSLDRGISTLFRSGKCIFRRNYLYIFSEIFEKCFSNQRPLLRRRRHTFTDHKESGRQALQKLRKNLSCSEKKTKPTSKRRGFYRNADFELSTCRIFKKNSLTFLVAFRARHV